MQQAGNLSEFNLFLDNNKDFLRDKFKEYFPNPATLQNTPVSEVIAYIYDIFSFQKYRCDPRVDTDITHSLQENISSFIQQVNALTFENKTAIDLLGYCIQHNEMFAVQYDIEENGKEKSSGMVVNILFESNNERNEHSGGEIEQHSGGEIEQHSGREIETGRSPRKHQQQEGNHQSQAMSNFTVEAELRQREGVSENEFDQHEGRTVSSNHLLIHKNARIVFDLFCKNQMQLGGMSTFDRLSLEASTMTLGKLLVYAKAYDLVNETLTKDVLISKFKKISEGKRAIDFEKFLLFLMELHIVDTTLYERMKLTDENLQKDLKFVKYPFYTQDQSTRELQSRRKFIHKLTSHSGKTSQELKDELHERKLSLTEAKTKMLKIFPINISKTNDILKLSPQSLRRRSKDQSVFLSVLGKIGSPQDKDVEWVSHQIAPYRRRNAQCEQSTDGPLARRSQIVDSIHKRIKQIETSQNALSRKQLVHRLTKNRRYIYN